MSAPDTPPTAAAPIGPAAHAGERRGPGPIVWVLLGAGLVCLAAVLVLVRFGPALLAARSAPVSPPPAAPSLDARLADIQARLIAQDATQRTRDQVVAPSAQVDALSQRLDLMEQRQQDALDAAAAALAVAGLDQAAQGSAAFTGHLGAVEQFLPPSPDTQALRLLAQAGAPSRAALAAEFPRVAARAAAAAQANLQGDGLGTRIARALAAVITIRRVDRLEGASADAVLARAEAKVNDGDLDGAVAEIDALPAPARAAAADWRRRAMRRIDIDRRLGAIRAQALAQLARSPASTQAQPGPPPAPVADPGPAASAAP